MLPRVKWSAQIKKVKADERMHIIRAKGPGNGPGMELKRARKRVIGIITHLLRYLLLDAFYFLTRFAIFFSLILALFPLFNDFTPLLERSMWSHFYLKP